MQKETLILFLLSVYSLLTLAQPAGQPWPRHTIDASSTGADGVKLADINKDGRPDIATGWEEGGITKVYLHPGKTQVKNVWPAVTVGKTPAVEDAVFADVDDDGKPEVVSCAEGKVKRIFVHFHTGDDPSQPEQWQQQALPAAESLMQWMYAEPLQVDGRHGIDLIAGGKREAAAIGWFEAPRKGRQLDRWQWHPISSVGWLMGLFLRDMDSDGDPDLVITDRYGDQQGCRWLENPGKRKLQKQAWASHLIGAGGLEVMFMDMADLDGDGTEEVLLCERTDESIRIYKRRDKTGKHWEEQTIALPAFSGRAKSITAGDLNADGIPDLVISTNTYGEGKHGLIWLDGRKTDAPRAADFQSISGMHNAKYDKVELLDIDEDGDLDVLICEENYGPDSEGLGVVWYENE
jgi:hypothetical protein